MGWCSGTEIFDAVCRVVLDSERMPSKRELIYEVAQALEDQDWYCQTDSDYFDHPVVKEVMNKLHPDWSDDV